MASQAGAGLAKSHFGGAPICNRLKPFENTNASAISLPKAGCKPALLCQNENRRDWQVSRMGSGNSGAFNSGRGLCTLHAFSLFDFGCFSV